MDLTGQAGFKIEYSIDDLSGNFVVTFKTPNGLSTLGTIEIEELKFRAMMESLAEDAKAMYDDLTPGLERRRTVFDKNNKVSTVTIA